MTPRGRRPGGADTRSVIVEAARVEFAAQGYDATSLRAVARRAEVDPALVHHYFGGKSALFTTVMDVPGSPLGLIGAVIEGPREQAGERLVHGLIGSWDTADGQQRFQALLRAAVTHDDAKRMLGDFLTREVFVKLVAAFAPPNCQRTDCELRASLAAAQVVGIALMRYIIEVPVMVEARQEDLARLVGPSIQRYLVD